MNYTSEHTISSTSLLSGRSLPLAGMAATEEAVDVSEQVVGFRQRRSSGIGERAENRPINSRAGVASGGVGVQQRNEGAAPPDSNTGVLTALNDWMSFTFPDNVHHVQWQALPDGSPMLDPLDIVKGLFGSDGWSSLERGDLGYKQGVCKGRVMVYFDGNPGMGIHVRVSGQGCREMEGASEFRGWQAFLTQVLDLGAKFTRFDVAMDDDRHITHGGEQRITMQKVQACVDNGQVVSTYRKARGMWEKALNAGSPEEVGNTIYFGSRQSDSLIRFYDKGLQQGMPESYVRVELELHDEQAQAMARLIASGAELGEVLAGVLRRKLDFKEQQGHSQRERRKTLAWWSDFLAGVEKLRLAVAPIVRTLQKAEAYLLRQAAPVFALITEIAELTRGADFVADLRAEGRRRWKKWHIEQLSSALSPLAASA